ncbi:MAG: glycosyltransferase [Prevotella sp.]|uniref:glycosyltransferase family 2 protein n=1 Tax=Prevotella sp. TaxID=59823 RepID=UPI002A3545B9|nr:glycosyltransferase [Prevotella sp.]MDD7318614.1 glycosyltransferase [Prevotellaceae bacterium]MDY4019430.1 glycosyltransferase [Prevotella sp.]
MMERKQHRIFAVIVTWNAMRHSWIDRCLRSLRSSTVAVTPIVIDNGSTDGTRQHVPAEYPEAVWLPQDTNLGFGRANNVGFRYALEHEADHVLLLNQDAMIMPDTLSLLLKQSDGESLLSPIHLNGNGTAFDINFERNTLMPANRLPRTIDGCRATPGRVETGEVCAACWLMPISMLKEIGGFNPLFFQYSEDNNYYDRMLFHKKKTFIIPAAEMWHDRKTYGSEDVYDHRLLRRTMLLAACDINASFLTVAKEIAWQLKVCYVMKLPRREYVVGTFSAELAWLLSRAGRIMKSRRKEKTIGMHWIPTNQARET